METNTTEEPKRPAHRPPLEDREKVASSHIHLRVTRKLKAAFVRHSHRQNKTLAEWLLGLGKKDCGYKGD